MINIKELPKVELHCHLDGSISVDTIKKLAVQANLLLPQADAVLKQEIMAPVPCNSLTEYLQPFGVLLQYLSSLECFEIAAYELMREAAAEHIMYIEIRFAPLLSVTEGMTARQIVASVISGIKRAERDFSIKGAVIICGMRYEDVNRNIALLEEIKDFYGQGVCAVDIAGGEAEYPPMLQAGFFQRAKELGIPYTIHAGECGSAQNVADVLALGTTRIGHGIALINDPVLRARCREKNIGIELCPTSNWQTKAIDTMENYPIGLFMNEGLLVTVNTDNRTVSNTTLTAELTWMAKEYQIDPILLTQNAIKVSFADSATKAWMKQNLEKFLKS